MRYIQKHGDGGCHLSKANNAPPTTSKGAQSRWKGFKKHKPSLSQKLNGEQFGLCAYSEIRFDLYSLGTHVEHVVPKNQAPQRTFDYHNLVLSALSSDDLHTMNCKDVFAGHAKSSEYDAALFISCLQVDCASFFVYLSTGKVEPKNQLTEKVRKKAQYTIDILNLNSPYLIVQRRKWIDELDQLIDEHIEKNMSLSALAEIDLTPLNNKIIQFYTATRQRYGKIAEQVLQANSMS